MGIKDDLGYIWKATFNDASIIEQFDGNTENLFKNVLDNVNNLKTFSIVSTDDVKDVYTVDLVNKTLIGPNVSYSITGSTPELIYFRRNSVRLEVGGNKDILAPLVTHHIGIKTSTQEKKFEVFKGKDTRPKHVLLNNVKASKKTDITK